MYRAALPSVSVVSWTLRGAVATTIVIWASAFVAIRAGLKGYSPLELAALRYLI
ncbi:MAG TPA: EamA/RhaT family transporter, partial [Candidatus Angelobacter sp.]